MTIICTSTSLFLYFIFCFIQKPHWWLPGNWQNLPSGYHDYEATPGIELSKCNVPGAGTFAFWDCAGQLEYHVTHAMFLGAQNCIYVLVYDITKQNQYGSVSWISGIIITSWWKIIIIIKQYLYSVIWIKNSTKHLTAKWKALTAKWKASNSKIKSINWTAKWKAWTAKWKALSDEVKVARQRWKLWFSLIFWVVK